VPNTVNGAKIAFDLPIFPMFPKSHRCMKALWHYERFLAIIMEVVFWRFFHLAGCCRRCSAGRKLSWQIAFDFCFVGMFAQPWLHSAKTLYPKTLYLRLVNQRQVRQSLQFVGTLVRKTTVSSIRMVRSNAINPVHGRRSILTLRQATQRYACQVTGRISGFRMLALRACLILD